MLCGWLGGFGTKTEGQLLPVERVGEIMNGSALSVLSTGRNETDKVHFQFRWT